MSIRIRRAGLADTDETAAVFSASFRSMPGIPKIHSDEEDRAFVGGLIATKDVWVALWDDHIAGMMCLNGEWLEQLYVHPDHQSRSVGYALFYTAKLERPKGFQFWTFQANKRARRFYEKLGCEPVKFTDGRNNEEHTPDVRYVYRGKKHRLKRLWRNVRNFSLTKDNYARP
ncbi:MAG TPA: GNAT family N-acetyltransferase [Rhizomicrobium sp.]|nr:GNAT family N-acetyltransferase [Rhizomicrobium sp.]